MTGSSPMPGTVSPNPDVLRNGCSSDRRVGGVSSSSARKSVDICEILRPKFASRGGRDGTVNSNAGSALDGAERAYGATEGAGFVGVEML
jgi:hypothetical protein